MIIDARKITAGTEIDCDICLVGGGAAGITLAKELSSQNLEIVLLESGGMKLETDTQDLYKGEILDPNHGELDEQRQRQLGGTTNVWGGRCAPYDALDFESRDYVPDSGWPITKADLDPYYQRAHDYCELGAYTYDIQEALGDVSPDMIPGLTADSSLETKLWLFSTPTNFKKTYLEFLKNSPRIKTYLYANCLKIITNAEGTLVEHLQVASLEKNHFRVRAKNYVLAMGGLEVTRLLLLSNDTHPQGIGNQNDLLGRFYMGHISGDVGKVTFTPKQGKVIWDYEKTLAGVYARRAIAIAPQVQQQQQLMNLRAILTYPEMSDPAHGNSVLSAMYLVKSILSSRQTSRIYYSKSMTTEGLSSTWLSHLKNITVDFPDVVAFASKWIKERLLSKRQLPSVVLGSKSNSYTFHFDAEQSPNYHSRVMLGEERDVFGLNRLKVDWQYTDFDLQNVIKSYQVIAETLQRTGTGKLEFEPAKMPDLIKQNLGVGSHHIGTTRMADSPSQGVVDRNCQVHGINNLYIASSSVFPTSSFANPTLTIVALAIRLADYLPKINQNFISFNTNSSASVNSQ